MHIWPNAIKNLSHIHATNLLKYMIPKSLSRSANSAACKHSSWDLNLIYVSSLIFSEVPPHSLETNHSELLKESWHLTHPSFHICYYLCLKCLLTFFAPEIFLHIQTLFIKHHLFLSCLPIPSYFVSPMSSHSTLYIPSSQSTFYIVSLLHIYLCSFLTRL